MGRNDDLLNPPKRGGLPVPLIAGAIVLLAAAAFFAGRLSGGGEKTTAPVAEGAGGAGGGAPAAAQELADGGTALAAADAGTAQPALAGSAATTPMGEPIPGSAALRIARVNVQGSLDQSLSAAVGPEVGAPLTQVSTRLLVWWLDIAREVRPGDELQVVYELPAGKEPLIHALRFTSSKLGRELRAYRFQEPGAEYGRYYDEKGAEVELRLEDSPIDSYDQITSLLRDGRRHKGVDFRAPVGTPVKAPWDGVVKRKNWGFRSNGNCLEIADGRGQSLYFLHLAEVGAGIAPGTRVKRGQQVALSGNSGRSTAPHLHYQLVSSSGAILDPFDRHKTFRVSVTEAARPAFDTARNGLDALLSAAVPPVAAAEKL